MTDFPRPIWRELMWECRDCREEFHVGSIEGIPQTDTDCVKCGSGNTRAVREHWPAKP